MRGCKVRVGCTLCMVLLFRYLVICQTCPTGYVKHELLEEGVQCCKGISCEPGHEVVPCKTPLGSDTCRECPAGKVMHDRTDSSFVAKCQIKACNERQIWTPTGCVCNTKNGYFGPPLFCEHKKCPNGTQLVVNGTCVHMKGSPREGPDILAGKQNGKPEDVGSESQNILSNTSTLPGSSHVGIVFIVPLTLALAALCVLGIVKYLKSRSSIRKHIKQSTVNYTGEGCVSQVGDGTLPLMTDGQCVEIPIPELATTRTFRDQDTSKIETQNKSTLQGDFQWRSSDSSEWYMPHFFSKTTKPSDYHSLPAKYEAGKSVGIIQDKYGTRYGTGFVVGKEFFLCNYHTLDIICHRLTVSFDDVIRYISMICEISYELCAFTFEGIVFAEASLDVIALKMRQEQQPFPPSLIEFGDAEPSERIDLIGYFDAEQKKIDQECQIKSFKSQEINDVIQNFRNQIGNFMLQNGLDTKQFTQPYEGMSSNFYYFDSSFKHGCSGSPGIVFVSPTHSKVVTMFIGCFPRFLWEASFDTVRDKLDQTLRFEFGPKMSLVFLCMKQRNPELCHKIFQVVPPEWDCAVEMD